MAVSKVILNGTTLIDTTDKTVTDSSMLSGVTALKNDGTTVTGNIASRTSDNVAITGNRISVSDGYYSANIVKYVSPGIAGTPTATKGTVSNHSVSVTPSVTNTTGYITGSAIEGTPVTVTASELESGTKTITENGTGIDVTGYAAVDVDVPSSGGVTVNPLSVNQNGTYTAPTGTAYSPVTVNVSGGGGSVEEKQVNFIDYDGTILYSYTAAEANALTELPANPSHTGLTAQGWNWTLAQIKAQLTALPDGPVWVGQMYITDDGKTRIYLTVDDMTKSFWLGLAVNGTVSIDWGDNSAASTLTGTSLATVKAVQHTYAVVGSYIIRVTVQSGGFTFYSNSSNYTRLIGKYETVSNYYNRVYGGCVDAIEIGSGVAAIGNNGFCCLFNLKSLTIPDGVTSIGTYAFNNCYALESITIPDGVTSIGNSAFCNCYALESITIPDGVTSIGASAFYSCCPLKSLTIPDGVTSIGTYAFQYCYALKSLTIPDGITSIGSYTFQNCYALKSLTIPDGVTSIGTYAFQYCYALKSLTIPDGVTSISINTFQNCYALESLTIPDGVTSIGNSAFSSCYALESLTIPDGVTSIGNSAFSNCYNVEEYHFLPTTPPTLGTTAFNYIQSGTKIYVPVGSLEAYQTATNWSTYASYMEEEPA